MVKNRDFKIDWKMYGSLIRMKRKEAGYVKADGFVNDLYDKTGLKLHVQSYYKIEQGKQVPTVEQFLSLNQMIYGNPLPESVFEVCALRD